MKHVTVSFPKMSKRKKKHILSIIKKTVEVYNETNSSEVKESEVASSNNINITFFDFHVDREVANDMLEFVGSSVKEVVETKIHMIMRDGTVTAEA